VAGEVGYVATGLKNVREAQVGDTITIADYFGAALVTLGELIGCDLAAYPNITRWLNNMKKLKSWPQVNEVFDGFKQHLKDQPFVAL